MCTVADRASRFLYTVFLAMDANFKLKGKDRGLTDLEMTPGWSYCMNEHEYQSYLVDYAHKDEVIWFRSSIVFDSTDIMYIFL